MLVFALVLTMTNANGPDATAALDSGLTFDDCARKALELGAIPELAGQAFYCLPQVAESV